MAPNTNIKSYLQQQHAIAAAAAAAELSASSSSYQSNKKRLSDKQKWLQQSPRASATTTATGSTSSPQLPRPPPPDVTRCYDEIDQIYDYIRGLAPLPDNLKSMKSIDFEKIEQRERLKRQQQQQQQQLHQEQKNNATIGAVAADKFLQLDQTGSGRKMAKLRQREAGPSVGNLAPNPPQVVRPATGQPPSATNKKHHQQLIVPMPIRVTTTTSESRRPTIKRVESLNLHDTDRLAGAKTRVAPDQLQKAHHHHHSNDTQVTSLQWRPPQHPNCKISSLKQQTQATNSKPKYLISAAQLGQQFRLPRAHSTSMLGKQARLNESSVNAPSGDAILEQNLARSRRQHDERQPSTSIVCSDLVESFVDDDDDDEVDDEVDETRGHDKQKVNRNSSSSSSSTSASDDDNDSKNSTTTSSTSSSSDSVYENKTGSSQTGATSDKKASALAQSSAARDRSNNRRQQVAASSSNSTKRSQEEHIYEQIPAHASAAEQHHVIARRSIAAAEAANKSMFDMKLRAPSGVAPEQRAVAHQINHPVAYSANIAANARYQKQVETLLAHQQRQTSQQHHLQHRNMPISQFSPTALSLNRATIVRATSNMSHEKQPQTATMPRALIDLGHHHRMSMGNLHMLNAAGIPLASLHNKRATAAVAAQAGYHASTLDKLGSLGRASSSSRVNRMGARPPKLSPAELIAHIQMPRAVSKRQVVATEQAGSGDPQSAGWFRKHPRQIDLGNAGEENRRQSIAYGANLWQQLPMRANVENLLLDKSKEANRKASAEQQLSTSSTANQLPASSNSSQSRPKVSLASKRASFRRLTAIGIEQAFDLVRHRPIATSPEYFEARRREMAPLVDGDQEDGSVSASADSQSCSSSQAAAGGGGAGNRRLDSVSDLHSFSSSSSTTTNTDKSSQSSSDMNSSSESGSNQSAEASGEPRPEAGKPLAGAPSRSHASLLSNNNGENLSGGRDANFVSSQSFIKCYYGDGDGDNKPGKPSSRVATTTTTSSSPTRSLAASKQKSKSKGFGSKLFGNGELLFSLIGLDAIGGGSKKSGEAKKSAPSSAEKTKVEPSQKPLSSSTAIKTSRESHQDARLSSRRTSMPPTPLAVNSMVRATTTANNQQSATSSKRRFSSLGASNSAGSGVRLDAKGSPALVYQTTSTARAAKDSGASARRRASATSAELTQQPRPRSGDLICHFEHPLVEIAKVPETAKVKRTKAASKERASSSSAGKSGAIEQLEIGSSETTNSTSSYEAAIKNSAEAAPKAKATANDKELLPAEQLKSHSTSHHVAASSTSIKVPKLSKQSHLLNRPLPKLPASCLSSARSGGKPGIQPNNTPAQQAVASYGGSSTVTRTNQRNSGVTNMQRAAGAIIDRYGTSRSDKSNGRAVNRYLIAQQHQQQQQFRATPSASSRAARTSDSSSAPAQSLASQPHQSLVSTNFDIAEPTGEATRELNSSTKRRQRQQLSTASSTGLKSPSATSHNQLSSLGTMHASPTVTTYTSSGISSTHLATNTSSSSSQRSKASASSNRDLAPIKMSSSSQKRATPGLSSLEGGSSSWNQRYSGDRSDDDSDSENKEEDVGNLVDDFDMIDEQGNSISPDIMRFGCGEGESARRGHLKSFDERFSTKYADQHLASSNDSLLESINFSGTLNSSRKKRQQLPAMTTSQR